MQPILKRITHEVEFSYNNSEYCVTIQGKVYRLGMVIGDDDTYKWHYIDEKSGGDDYDFIKKYGLKILAEHP